MTDHMPFGHNTLRVNGRVAIPLSEIQTQVSRSGGPGGQHVNTSSTKVEVRWNLDQTRALSAEEQARVREKLGDRVDADGAIRVTSSESRSQRRNRELAEARLAEIIRRALVVPKPRRASKRPRRANENRLQSKHFRGEIKKGRHWKGDE